MQNESFLCGRSFNSRIASVHLNIAFRVLGGIQGHIGGLEMLQIIKCQLVVAQQRQSKE
jgi:hypothetical protein